MARREYGAQAAVIIRKELDATVETAEFREAPRDPQHAGSSSQPILGWAARTGVGKRAGEHGLETPVVAAHGASIV
jgi:hypothetical protein